VQIRVLIDVQAPAAQPRWQCASLAQKIAEAQLTPNSRAIGGKKNERGPMEQQDRGGHPIRPKSGHLGSVVTQAVAKRPS